MDTVDRFPVHICPHPLYGDLMTVDRRRGDAGTYEPEYDAEGFLDALRAHGGSVVPTRAVVDEVGCARDTAIAYLQQLVEDGAVEKHDVGAGFAWSVTDSEE